MPANIEELNRMEELQAKLKEAADAYYNRDIEIMTNYEYDALYDELLSLEESTGTVLDGSITQTVGSDASASALPKVEHESPMLSLGKTKSREELAAWLGEREGCLSYKLDGSTVVLTYDGGRLVRAVTRGNGRIGEDITAQARKFAFVPGQIGFSGKLVVRGEALMTYSEFERINAEQGEGAKYKNPRNLASGTMRALDTSLLDERVVEFHPFTLVSADGYDENSYSARLDWLAGLGFSPVEHRKIVAGDIEAAIAEIESGLAGKDFPSDGLVLFFDDVAYGDSLGMTGHHPRNGIAFKWQDETVETELEEIVWQPSRTGRINPVAVFAPVELEGTTVSRASLHNLTVMRDLLGDSPHIGQKLTVYKANSIIPTVVSAVKDASPADLHVPGTCPACGGRTQRSVEQASEFLMCGNPQCPARMEGAFSHFVSRDALDVRGLSKETLSKLMEAGIVASFADILALPEKHDEIVGVIDGIKEKSFSNIAAAVETARETTAARFLYALGIREIGRSASRDIMAAYGNDVAAMVEDAASGETGKFTSIDGVGPVMAEELCSYMAANSRMVGELLGLVNIGDAGAAPQATDEGGFVSGKVFVITGAVERFANRNEFKSYVESCGGKVAGSVSGKTDFLVTNTPDSGTAKNRKARELGVAVITEAEFCERAGIDA